MLCAPNRKTAKSHKYNINSKIEQIEKAKDIMKTTTIMHQKIETINTIITVLSLVIAISALMALELPCTCASGAAIAKVNPTTKGKTIAIPKTMVVTKTNIISKAVAVTNKITTSRATTSQTTANKTAPNNAVRWYDASHLTVEGRGFADTAVFYDRLPARAKTMVRPPVWGLSHDSAGICVHFQTNSDKILTRWTLRSANLSLPHMPATGVSGVDLYIRAANSTWRWLGNTKVIRFPTTTATLASGVTGGMHEYRLYLPLYNGVSKVEIGVPARYRMVPYHPDSQDNKKPLVFYGTSITQGACASRPGMAYVAIVGRHFDVPVVNLGFSGNGKMEIELAKLLSQVPASVYIIDCLPNMTPAMVAQRTVPFVRFLHERCPKTPIILAEHPNYPNSDLKMLKNDVRFGRDFTTKINENLHKAYENLKKLGISNLYIVPGKAMYGFDGEGTVGGVHPNDLGNMRLANTFITVLKPVMDKLYSACLGVGKTR